MCHLVLLLPVFGLPLFWLLPLGYALPLNILLWLVSAFLYREIVRAMAQPPRDGFKSLIGTRGEVVGTVSPDYYAQYLVRAGGELWSARCAEVLQPGDMVRIAAVDGISLVVESRQTGVKVNERHCH